MMSTKKKVNEDAIKRRKDTIIMEIKVITEKHDHSVHNGNLARIYRWTTSNINTILKKEIKKLVHKRVIMITKHQLILLKGVGKLLLVWTNDKKFAGDSIQSLLVACYSSKQHFTVQ